MEKYVINHVIAGYHETFISDPKLLSGDDKIIVLVLDNTTSNKLREYYNSVRDILLSRNKLITIIVGKDSNIRKPIANLMATYRNYNIYKVSSAMTVDRDYAEALEDREPTIDEVQQFVGGDISAYAEIANIVSGINELANEGDIEKIKSLIEQHRETIESSREVLDYMHKIVDESNSGELHATIDTLRSKLNNIEEKDIENQKEIRDLRSTTEHLKSELMESKRELNKANSELQSMKSQSNNGSPILESYPELSTQRLKNTCDHIIYFKELSYVRYMNSFVIAIQQFLKLKLRVKLIIYDNKVGIPSVYRPLSVIDSSSYMANKSNFIQNAERFVVVEPNPVILENMVTSLSPKFDVIIIYDRMRQQKDLITGNNVTKFYVINSNRDFEESQKMLGIKATDTIISGPESSIPNALDIKTIPGYLSSTDTAKLAKYKKNTSSKGVPLMSTILDKCRIKLNND